MNHLIFGKIAFIESPRKVLKNFLLIFHTITFVTHLQVLYDMKNISHIMCVSFYFSVILNPKQRILFLKKKKKMFVMFEPNNFVTRKISCLIFFT